MSQTIFEDNRIRVQRTILIAIDDQDQDIPRGEQHGVSVFLVNTTYTDAGNDNLLQYYGLEVSSDTIGKFYARRSSDNGDSWSDPVVVLQPEETSEGVFRWGESCLFCDEERGRVLHFSNRSLYPATSYSGDVARLTRVYMRESQDGGAGFSAPRQIVQHGCDEEAWAEGVIYGRNSMAISFCAAVKLSSGELLLPASRVPLESDYSQPFLLKDEACCLMGTWGDEGLIWDVSEKVRIDPESSSRGLCEPTVAELDDGTVMMICRGSNSTITAMPGRKWYTTSSDGGRSWSEIQALTYDTGEPFFSPATGSRLIHHARSGKLFWIGNIVPENPDGNRPRYPLQIAEVDQERRAIRKDTVSVIEDRREGDSPMVQFSNFRVYEDRRTGDFVLTLARIQERSEHDLTSPAYQYRVSFHQ